MEKKSALYVKAHFQDEKSRGGSDLFCDYPEKGI